MTEIPDEIRKMFPTQPIHKMDIDDNGELHILASAEPFELDPHVEDWATEQVNAYLREHGYDPEQVGIRGKILTDALIENVKLKEALNEAGDVIASIVSCCTYGSEEQARAGAYGISHEAFTRIDAFIRKYGDLLQAIDPKKGGE